jgi:peptide chain release factor 3
MFTGIPQFSPDIFCRVELRNPIKNKQLHKGLEQLTQEGTSQLFRRKHLTESILGVVGQLQLEVVKFRLLNEYGADAVFAPLPYEASRWFSSADKNQLAAFESYYAAHIVYDVRGYPVILLRSEWEKNYVAQQYPNVQFFDSLLNYRSLA